MIPERIALRGGPDAYAVFGQVWWVYVGPRGSNWELRIARLGLGSGNPITHYATQAGAIEAMSALAAALEGVEVVDVP